MKITDMVAARSIARHILQNLIHYPSLYGTRKLTYEDQDIETIAIALWQAHNTGEVLD